MYVMKAVHRQFGQDFRVCSPLIILVWQIPCPSARVVVACFKLDPLERILCQINLAEDVRWLVSPISNRAFTFRLCFWTPGSNAKRVISNEKQNSLPVCAVCAFASTFSDFPHDFFHLRTKSHRCTHASGHGKFIRINLCLKIWLFYNAQTTSLRPTECYAN